MAEFVMKERVRQAGLDAAVYVESAAMHRDEIGSDVHYGTKEILDRYGIPYEHRAARLATTATTISSTILWAWIATTCAT